MKNEPNLIIQRDLVDKNLFITYDENLTPVDASPAALNLQQISFDEFKYFGKHQVLNAGNLSESVSDFISDNKRTLKGEYLLNLEGHFYGDKFRALFSRRHPIYSKMNLKKIIGVHTIASPIENIFYPEITAIINSKSVNVHQKVKENFSLFFNKKRDDILLNKWKLTNKELSCVYYILKGMTNSEIAKEFNISPRTIETHINNIKKKMKINNKRIIFDLMSEILLTNF